MIPWQDNPLRRLLTWTRWLSLHHPTIRFVNIVVPAMGFAVCLLLGLAVPALNFTRDLGVIQQVNGLLQILAPFFVAALALIAGFPGPALDQPMGGVQPTLIVGGQEYVPRRRELLGYLFAYLAALSIVVYLGGGLVIAGSNPTSPNAFDWVRTALSGYLSMSLKAAYGALLIHLFAVTLLGLNFLGNFLTSSKILRDPQRGAHEHGRSSSESTLGQTADQDTK